MSDELSSSEIDELLNAKEIIKDTSKKEAVKKNDKKRQITKDKLARIANSKIKEDDKKINLKDTESITLLTQDDLDGVLGNFISDEGNSNKHALIDEIKEALLDSGRLSLREWKALRKKVREISEMLPHIEFILELLKEKKNR